VIREYYPGGAGFFNIDAPFKLVGAMKREQSFGSPVLSNPTGMPVRFARFAALTAGPAWCGRRLSVLLPPVVKMTGPAGCVTTRIQGSSTL
jgi:hypothetical protein